VIKAASEEFKINANGNGEWGGEMRDGKDEEVKE